MVPVTTGTPQYDRLGKKGFSPKGDEAPAVEMARMDCPDPQGLDALPTITIHLSPICLKLEIQSPEKYATGYEPDSALNCAKIFGHGKGHGNSIGSRPVKFYFS